MPNEFVKRDVVPLFSAWAEETSTEEIETLSGGFDSVADFICAWVESGEGVKACYGDYQTFLRTVIMIIADFHKG